MTENDKSAYVAQICSFLLEGDIAAARQIALTTLPFEPIPRKVQKKIDKAAKLDSLTNNSLPAADDKANKTKRAVPYKTRLAVWQRDGFRCRYTDKRLVFPPVLEILSYVLPNELPYYNPPHGNYDYTHVIMWELSPVIDHVKAVSRSADTRVANALDILATASAFVNSDKDAFDLDELGWTLLPPTPSPDWDGLLTWYVQYLAKHESWLEHPKRSRCRYLRDWYHLVSMSVV